MKKPILLILAIMMAVSSYCQSSNHESNFNFDFEKTKKGYPDGWDNFGNGLYQLSIDSTIVESGKYSVSIESIDDGSGFKALGFTLPENYKGKKITLSGYIKTENVSEGWAGLWMRIDPSIAFDNMKSKGIVGTTGWIKYEVTLVMNPSKTQKIVVGALLAGKGKIWIDNLQVTIDGKDMKECKPFEKELVSADKDHQYDSGSMIGNFVLDSLRINNLKKLGLVWGFLKYYHPAVAKGDYNWDYELFRILPAILEANSKSNCDSILTKWIINLGDFEQVKKYKVETKNAKILPDLDWISNSGLSKELSESLLRVKMAKRKENNYYIGFHKYVWNPEFKNESEYASMEFPDPGFRLLALYRFWNNIQYFFPYKNLIEEDWKGVLEEFIPKIIYSSNEIEYDLVILELIARINDTHANLWKTPNQHLSDYLGANFSALEITFIENKAVVTGYYDNELGRLSEINIGDIITKVNNVDVEKIVSDKLKLTPASNYPTKLREIARTLLRTNDTILQIDYIRNVKVEKKIVSTYPLNKINIYGKLYKNDTCFRFIEPDIAYLYLGTIKNKYLSNFFKSYEKAKGLIIDLRCYPSDFVVFSLSSYLMPYPTDFVKFSGGSITNPGLFATYTYIKVEKKNKNYFKGKVVILVNEMTQSQAEYTAMALRVSPNATVIGSTTAGADGNVSDFSLPGGLGTMISGIGVYYPDGRETQRIGIVPDIEIKPTIEGIKNGRDELMEKAIEIIKRK